MFKRSHLFLLMALLLFVTACQTDPQLPATSVPTLTAATDTPQPTITPTPGVSSTEGWRELLSYVSPEWVNIHSTESPIGSVLYLADVAQLRADLKLPPVTGADDRKAKLPLITKLTGVISEIDSSGHFKQRGWDIADVQQIAYFWDDYTQLLRGNFARPEIRQRLLDQGYTESQLGEFAIFTKEGPRVDQYAWKPDTIIISPDESILKSLIQRKMDGREGLDQHPVVAQMLQRLEGAWGALLTTAGSAEVMQRYLGNLSTIDNEWEKALKEKWPEMLTNDFEFGWDVLGIGWKGARPEVAFTILYHYPSAAETEKDIPLLKKTLTDMPSFVSRSRLWSDMLDVQKVETDGEFLIAQADAKTDSIFSTAIANRDFTFLPIRTVPRAAQSTPTAVSPAKVITSSYGSNWTLYTNEREGFALALPPKWAQIDLDPAFIEAGVQLLLEQNPDLPQEFGDQIRRAAASGMKFVGFDVSPAGRKASLQVEVDVMKADVPRGYSLDSVVSQIMQQLDKLTTIVEPVRHERVRLKAGEAERLRVTYRLTLPSGQKLSLEADQYVLLRDNVLYVLSLAAPTKFAQDYTETFKQIADSFQFVK